MKGYRTLIFGALITLLGGIQAADLAQIVPTGWLDVVMALIGIVIMVLRTLTSTPVLTKES
jgi:hypothetical protein